MWVGAVTRAGVRAEGRFGLNMPRFDVAQPWWVRDAARGAWGGATGVSLYGVWTGDGAPETRLLLAAIIVTALAWYFTAVARWRRDHRQINDR